MFKIILKNLWARRWRNGWLFAELIIVAVVAWNVIDPIIVDSWVFSQPMGFETNRVCMVNIALMLRMLLSTEANTTQQ